MGLFSFIKEAGEKLFGASEAKAATPDELKKEIAKHGLKVDGLDIAVSGDTVKVSGKALSTEEARRSSSPSATPSVSPPWRTRSLWSRRRPRRPCTLW